MSKGNFAGLLAELGVAAAATDVLAKSVTAEPAKDDKKVETAAAEAGVQKPVIAGEDAGAKGVEEVDGEEDDGPEFGKSITFIDEDGQEHVALDATELVKSLHDRLNSTDDVLAKAVPQLLTMLGAQETMIKSLHARMEQLGGQGRGRRTMLSIVEKPAVGEQLAKSAAAEAGDGKITHAELLAKADGAFSAKKISDVEYNMIDVCLRTGEAIPAALLSKVALS